MTPRRSTPLLRVAALGATLLSCSTPAAGTPEDGPDPADPAELASSRVRLRGVVVVPTGVTPTRVVLHVETPAGRSPDIVLPEGPSPRPFRVLDADLAGLDVPDDQVTLVASLEMDGPTFYQARATLPARSAGLRMVPTWAVPPLPADAVPTREQVLAMPPAQPDERGSRLDLQGVLVFDNRRGTPKFNMQVRDATGGFIEVPVSGPSPVAFRIQDSAVRREYPMKADEVTLHALVHFGDGRMLTTQLTVPVQAKGIVLVPSWEEPPRPEGPKLTSGQLDLEGVVEQPEGRNPRDAELYVVHGAGASEAIPLGDGPWPRPFHLSGPAWEDVPVVQGVTVYVKVQTDDGEQVAVLDTPLTQQGLVLRPRRIETPKDAPERPVYGNTKGSRYDEGVLEPTKRP